MSTQTARAPASTAEMIKRRIDDLFDSGMGCSEVTHVMEQEGCEVVHQFPGWTGFRLGNSTVYHPRFE